MYLVYIILLLALLYLFSIKPNKRRDLNFLLGPYYAHRGVHNNNGVNPENSLLAFKMAVDMGFGIELDVQVTRDNVPVVFHDNNLSRVCNLANTIQDFTLEQLRDLRLFNTNEPIPTLKDVLSLVNGSVPLVVEIKNETTDISELKHIAKLLDNYNGDYVIESFNPLVLMWYKKNRPLIIRGQLATRFKKKHHSFSRRFRDFFLENLLSNFLVKPDFIAFNYKYKNMLSFKLCKLLYNPITAAYTIKSQQSLQDNLSDFDLFIFDSFIPKEDTKPN